MTNNNWYIIQVYNESIRDLLSSIDGGSLELREDAKQGWWSATIIYSQWGNLKSESLLQVCG